MLTTQIQEELKTAMKAGDGLRTSVLRMLISEFNYKKIDLGRELTDEDVMAVLAREAKKRREAIDSFTAGGRMEQVEQEKAELVMILAYLPKMMNEEEISKEVIELLSNKDIKDFGQAMRMVAPIFKGRADGSLVARIVKEYVDSGH